MEYYPAVHKPQPEPRPAGPLQSRKTSAVRLNSKTALCPYQETAAVITTGNGNNRATILRIAAVPGTANTGYTAAGYTKSFSCNVAGNAATSLRSVVSGHAQQPAAMQLLPSPAHGRATSLNTCAGHATQAMLHRSFVMQSRDMLSSYLYCSCWQWHSLLTRCSCYGSCA